MLLVAALAVLTAATSSHANPDEEPSWLPVGAVARPGAVAPLVDTDSTKHLVLEPPDGYAGLVISVFKMKLKDFLPYDEKRSRARIQPYLLGGTIDVKTRRDRLFGRDIPGEQRSTALHLGGGTEVRLNSSLSLSFDFGEVVGTGPTGSFDYQAYQLGLQYKF